MPLIYKCAQKLLLRDKVNTSHANVILNSIVILINARTKTTAIKHEQYYF